MMYTYRSKGLVVAVVFVVTAVLAVATAGELAGQDLPSWCPEPFPFEDGEALVQHLDGIASGEVEFSQPGRRAAIIRVLVRAFPGEERPCPAFGISVDPREVMIRVMEFARDYDDVGAALQIVSTASSVSYRRSDAWGWDPTDLLFEIVEEGRTEGARGGALRQLVRRAEQPEIRGRLLALARQPEGPPAWPDLSVDLVKLLEFAPTDGAQALEAEILVDPSQLAHPRARWEVECGRGHAIPRPPDDPCFPANAPPRIDGRGGWPDGSPPGGG